MDYRGSACLGFVFCIRLIQHAGQPNWLWIFKAYKLKRKPRKKKNPNWDRLRYITPFSILVISWTFSSPFDFLRHGLFWFPRDKSIDCSYMRYISPLLLTWTKNSNSGNFRIFSAGRVLPALKDIHSPTVFLPFYKMLSQLFQVSLLSSKVIDCFQDYFPRPDREIRNWDISFWIELEKGSFASATHSHKIGYLWQVSSFSFVLLYDFYNVYPSVMSLRDVVVIVWSHTVWRHLSISFVMKVMASLLAVRENDSQWDAWVDLRW